MADTENCVMGDVQVIERKKIKRLVALAKEKSYRMPSGLTRRQRRYWAKTMIKKV